MFFIQIPLYIFLHPLYSSLIPANRHNFHIITASLCHCNCHCHCSSLLNSISSLLLLQLPLHHSITLSPHHLITINDSPVRSLHPPRRRGVRRSRGVGKIIIHLITPSPSLSMIPLCVLCIRRGGEGYGVAGGWVK